eukprot:4355187-Prymnesium_polylepis.1
MDGKDEAEPAATGIVEALADLTVAQQDASEALSEGFKELEEVEAELAAELGVTVEELEVVEDSALGLIAPPPDGFEWGDTY